MSAAGPELQYQLSKKEQCIQRHDKVRVLIILGALLLMFLCAVIFFTRQTVVPMLIVTLFVIVVYKYINHKLRAEERSFL
jgi:cobalamin synthase